MSVEDEDDGKGKGGGNDDSDPPNEPSCKVGKCNPPTHTRFQRGGAGNRKGRLKDPDLDLSTTYQEISAELIAVKLNGKPKKLSRLESTVARQVDLALKANTRAARAILERALKHGFTKETLHKSFIKITDPDGEFGEILRIYPRLASTRGRTRNAI